MYANYVVNPKIDGDYEVEYQGEVGIKTHNFLWDFKERIVSVIVSCSIFIWITNSSDHRMV